MSVFSNRGWVVPDWPAPSNILACTTTRMGGYSAAPFNSLNLAEHVGDDPATVAANREFFAAELGANSTPDTGDGLAIQWLSQLHGTRAVEADPGAPTPAADASWSRASGIACAVLTADCLPVLFCDQTGDTVAAAHAGWRGLLAGVLESTLEAMRVPPSTLLAWLGPAIGPRAFEVGPEVRQSYLAVARPPEHDDVAACFQPNPRRGDHYFANLYELARLRLRRAGVSQIYGGLLCTLSDPQRFYSHRRDGECGRMASVIMRCSGNRPT